MLLGPLDPEARALRVELDDAEIAARAARWKRPDGQAEVRRGSVLDKYVRLVSSAHYGCVLQERTTRRAARSRHRHVFRVAQARTIARMATTRDWQR